jgi:tetratricopeptide (TPR) repeat protein
MDEFLRRQPAVVPPSSFSNTHFTRHPYKVLGLSLIFMFVILAVLVVQVLHLHPTKSVVAKADNSIGHAVAGLDSVLKVDPKNVGALVAKSVTLTLWAKSESNPGLAVQAVTAAEDAIAIDPKNSEAYRALGYANELQQKYTEAHAAYQKAVELNPKDTIALLSDLRLYELESDVKMARDGYVAALKQSPSLYAARLGLARVERVTDKTPDAAMKDFKTVYTESKNSRERAEAAYGIGSILLSQNKRDASRQYMSETTTLDPAYASGWFGLGTVEYMQVITGTATSSSDRERALAESMHELNTAVKLDPNLTRAYVQLAVVSRALDQTKSIANILATATAVVPKDTTLGEAEKGNLLKVIAKLASPVKSSK